MERWSGGAGVYTAVGMRDALGTKGAAKSIGDALVATNPNYSGDYREYSHNCQRCVVAYELRRRGYDVTALPTYEGDQKNKVAYLNSTKGIYEGRWKGAFKNAKTVNVGATTERKVMSNIDKQMSKAGEGSRGVIQIFYKGGGGHVFNVERKNGKTVYMEAQTGKVKDMAKTLGMVKTQSVNFVRTDNLRISGRITDFVTRSGGKATSTGKTVKATRTKANKNNRSSVRIN